MGKWVKVFGKKEILTCKIHLRDIVTAIRALDRLYHELQKSTILANHVVNKVIF